MPYGVASVPGQEAKWRSSDGEGTNMATTPWVFGTFGDMVDRAAR
jgi:hypothetical protein